ncbi:hypothetical protein ECANGB1_2238 [Enterospora canceri]|uniref:Uncharacterized protein n=1 Tax=Enterospora canceri TaxID=1081671 RepID=A0A1Y1S4X2_9MICR|nr:hypothetical protein ECANGB1_2238 [Enterospora canceri]
MSDYFAPLRFIKNHPESSSTIKHIVTKDIDGIKGAATLSALHGIKHKVCIELKNSSQTIFTSRFPVQLNDSFYNISELMHIRLGTVHLTSVHTLTYFIVVGEPWPYVTDKNRHKSKYSTGNKQDSKRFFNRLLTAAERIFTKLSKEYSLANATIRFTPNNEITAIADEAMLKTLLRNLAKEFETETFLFFEAYNMKQETTHYFLDPFERIIENHYDPAVITLYVDASVNYAHRGRKLLFLKEFTTNAHKIGLATYKPFMLPEIHNIHGYTLRINRDRTRLLSKCSTLSKVNFYNSLSNTILIPAFRKKAYPVCSVSVLILNFFGISFAKKYDFNRKMKYKKEFETAIHMLEKNKQSSYTFRFEATVTYNNLDKYLNFIYENVENDHFHEFEQHDICRIFKNVLEYVYNQIFNEVNSDIRSYIRRILCEIFLFEFFLRGGRNKRVLHKEYADILLQISTLKEFDHVLQSKAFDNKDHQLHVLDAVILENVQLAHYDLLIDFYRITKNQYYSIIIDEDEGSQFVELVVNTLLYELLQKHISQHNISTYNITIDTFKRYIRTNRTVSPNEIATLYFSDAYKHTYAYCAWHFYIYMFNEERCLALFEQALGDEHIVTFWYKTQLRIYDLFSITFTKYAADYEENVLQRYKKYQTMFTHHFYYEHDWHRELPNRFPITLVELVFFNLVLGTDPFGKFVQQKLIENLGLPYAYYLPHKTRLHSMNVRKFKFNNAVDGQYADVYTYLYDICKFNFTTMFKYLLHMQMRFKTPSQLLALSHIYHKHKGDDINSYSFQEINDLFDIQSKVTNEDLNSVEWVLSEIHVDYVDNRLYLNMIQENSGHTEDAFINTDELDVKQQSIDVDNDDGCHSVEFAADDTPILEQPLTTPKTETSTGGVKHATFDISDTESDCIVLYTSLKGVQGRRRK